MKKLIIGFILGAMVFGVAIYAGETISKFEDIYISVLNTRLDRIEADARLLNERVTALE